MQGAKRQAQKCIGQNLFGGRGGGRQSSHRWCATDGSLWPSSSQAYEEMGELGMERQWEAEQLQLLADKSSRVA
jgi:hypothetical protein